MMLEKLSASTICGFAKLLTGVRPVWRSDIPDEKPRVYYANHRSHGDFVLIWSCLPSHLRRKTRPVAGADYWNSSALRKYIIHRVFRGVVIERSAVAHQPNPVELMSQALAASDSLIIFPEGTRNMGDALLPFKSGIYRLAKAHPEVEFVPVWIENLGRVMPKGTFVPVPLLCSLVFGQAISLNPDDSKDTFLETARSALLALAPTCE